MPVGTAAAVKAVTRARPRGGGRADHPRQHLPPDAAPRRRAGARASAACTASRAGPALPHRQRRLPGLQPRRAAPARRGGRRASRATSTARAHLLTPERSMEIQMNLGADIVMAFDECPPWPAPARGGARRPPSAPRAGRGAAATRTRRADQWLFGIVQGGVHLDLRERSAARDRRPRLPRLRDRRALGGRAQGGHAPRARRTSIPSCPRTGRAT